MTTTDHTCEAPVSNPWPGLRTCRRAGRYEENGKRYCKQHIPSRVKAREKARDAKYRAVYEAQDARRTRQGHGAILARLLADMSPGDFQEMGLHATAEVARALDHVRIAELNVRRADREKEALIGE